MAYVDYDFYTTSYFGSVVPESEFPRVAEQASDFVDVMTFDRLAGGLPSDERSQKRIKKAVCALADKIYELDLAEKNSVAAAGGSTTTVGTNGSATGIITSVSSGSESISYASLQQVGAGAKEWNALYAVAGDPEKTNKMLEKTAKPLLSGICTDEGIPILYAGL